jgi:hypothetical protein
VGKRRRPVLDRVRGRGNVRTPQTSRTRAEIAPLDARWFKAHPERRHRVRLAEEGEVQLPSVLVDRPVLMAMRWTGKEGAPTYGASETPNRGDRTWGRQVHDYYRVRPYWE